MHIVKIIILTECGGDIGYGHISRCSAVYQALEDKGFTPELIVHGDEHGEKLFAGKRHQIFDWINNRKKLPGVLENSDIAFVDSYLAGPEVYDFVSKHVETAVYFDDDLRIDYPKGIVLNGAISAKELHYPAKNGVSYLLGATYFPLRKEFCNAPEKEIRREVETLLVTCGGSDMYNLTPTIQTFLNDTYPDLNKKIIVTSLFSNISEIKKLQDSNTELLFDLNAIDFMEAMQDSDIAISAGGQTLYELASVGLPTIAFCVAENQLQNVIGWSKTGTMEYAGRYEDKFFLANLSKALDREISFEKRANNSRGTRELVDGNGAKRLANEVLSEFYHNDLSLREATKKDAKDIFELANDIKVRRNSFEPRQIGWEDHIKWFSDKLSDNNCWLFVVESQGRFAGQVRFNRDIEDDSFIISISLTQSFRGLKLSEKVIDKAIAMFSDCCRETGTIIAYIKRENAASISAFENADFVFYKNAMVKGSHAKAYVRTIKAV